MATQTIASESMEMMSAVQTRGSSIAERNRALFELQRRARRGPTPEVFFAKHIDNSRIVKADDPQRRR
ncbi:MAG: cell division protein FtsL, partial [Acidobacteriaceae bacterium]|nr:cell division protein FtsL [Acidobacteriaceae bacterium]